MTVLNLRSASGLVLLLVVCGLLVCGGCGGDQQATTADAGSGSAGAPPPPAVAPQSAESATSQQSNAQVAESPNSGAQQPGTQYAGSQPGTQYPGAQYPGSQNPGLPADMSNSSPNTNRQAYGTGPQTHGDVGSGRKEAPLLPPLPDGPPMEGFQVGSIAPEIVGEDLDGEPFRLSDYRGKVVVVDFWGDW